MLAFYKFAHLVNTTFLRFSPNLLFLALHFFKAFATMEKALRRWAILFHSKGSRLSLPPSLRAVPVSRNLTS